MPAIVKRRRATAPAAGRLRAVRRRRERHVDRGDGVRLRTGGVSEAGFVAAVQLAPDGRRRPFAAYCGDRFRRDVVLAVGYLAQSVCMLATATAMWQESPAVVVYAAAASAAVAVTFTRPAMGALLPALTSTPADVTAANVCLGVLEHLGIFSGRRSPACCCRAAAILHGCSR